MGIARREFLKVVSSASVIGGLSGISIKAGSASASVPAFGFDDNSVPMNAAHLCPMPTSITEAQAKYAAQLDLSLSSASRRAVEAGKEQARSRIARLLGVSNDELAIVRNTSEANNIIVQGMPLAADDEVVLWDQNHPSNLVAWDVQVSRMGSSVRRFSIPTDVGSIDEVVDLFVRSVTDSTKVVSFTHISNITGFQTPVAQICAAIRKRKDDIHIHVDGAQTWGAVDIDLGTVDCDSFSGSAHKWFMGPREVGILYVRDASIDGIWPNVVSVPWGRTDNDAPKGARKFESVGQRDDAAIAALSDTAFLHETITPASIEQRSTMVATRLREGLQDLDLAFISTANPAFTSSVIILQAPRRNAAKLVGQIFKDSGIQTAPTGGLRMSPHMYNTGDHVDRLIAAVKKNRALLT
jgi:selenocysteine lyase/cysteine desulfurase